MINHEKCFYLQYEKYIQFKERERIEKGFMLEK